MYVVSTFLAPFLRNLHLPKAIQLLRGESE
jgi:hypothetical protein